MKTVVIYDQLDGELSFFVLGGDFSHLHKTYINSVESDEDKQDELNDALYYASGDFKNEVLSEFPVEIVRNGAQVIVCGFLP